MSEERFRRVSELFVQAKELGLYERDLFLVKACAGDDDLRREVEQLVNASDEPLPFAELADDLRGAREQISAATETDEDSTIAHERGTRIGPYELLEKIGEGGFGLVYVAEQQRPVKRRVALKIIKLGMDTRQVIARFEAERQALAMMDHPNIAQVFDAGETDTGRPYFVMELVRGVPITEYCDTQNLDTQTRLDLFTRVCHAIQHAHQKGVIHRDIKPSNVMVTLHDGVPVPKVIDFGVAKATNAELTEKTIYTLHHQMIGTPTYMSPEQAEMSGLDIDTRSDIYSLGVLLYELLTGLTPFDARRLQAAGYDELRRIIREEEPPKPSTRLSGFLSEPSAAGGSGNDLRDADRKLLPHGPGSDQGSSAFDIARFCRTDPTTLSRSLRGDLDWIVMKCLEKDRQRRYETANSLAADIQRHLNDEPVLASPPSASYRFRKFARRNKRLLGSVTGIAAALVIGLTLATYGFITASNERDQKITALDQEKQARAEAEAVNDFLNTDLLAAVAPSAEQARGRDVLMRDVLDAAAQRIDEASAPGGRFADQPLVEASIRMTLGETYRQLGRYQAAGVHFQRARQLYDREHGNEHPDTLSAMNSLALVYLRRGRYTEAEALFLDTLENIKHTLGEEHPNTLSSMNNLANLYSEQGRYAEAEALYLDTLEIQKRILGEEDPATLKSMNNLANGYQAQRRYPEAEVLYLETLEIRNRILGEEHPETLTSIMNLANVYQAQGRYAEAETLLVDMLEIQKRILGEEHPETLASIMNLANGYHAQDRYAEAEALYLDTLEIQKRILGEEHPTTLRSMNNLAILYWRQGRYDDAEPLYLRALAGRRRVLGNGHPDTIQARFNLIELYKDQGKVEQARPLIAERLAVMREAAERLDADAHTLNGAAWDFLTVESLDLRDPQTALRLTIRANDMTGHEEALYLDTLALAYHMTADTPRALEVQREALVLLTDKQEQFRGEMELRLAEYKAALEAGIEGSR